MTSCAARQILAIEDDPILGPHLKTSLEHRGFHVTLADDGPTGLALASEATYDLILLDVMLPELSGMELLTRLREQRRTPVLMMSALGNEAHRIQGFDSGADDYLPKPATVPMILRALGEEDDGPADDGEMEPPDAMTPISRLQWEHIQQAMHETGGNVSAAARLLGMHRRSLQRKLAKRPSPERDPSR